MGIGALLHRQPNPDTEGFTIDHGRGYDLFAQVFFAGHRDRIYTELARLARVRTGDRVLDIGCGSGYLTQRLARQAGPQGQVTGIDPSGTVLEYARAEAGADCSFEVGIAEQLPAADSSVDVVASCLMVHHLPADIRDAAVAEMFRVLRPGGTVLIADFRPPANPVGRHLIGAITGPAMEFNQYELLAPMAAAAGFTDVDQGQLRPWIHWVRATKPERES